MKRDVDEFIQKIKVYANFIKDQFPGLCLRLEPTQGVLKEKVSTAIYKLTVFSIVHQIMSVNLA